MFHISENLKLLTDLSDELTHLFLPGQGSEPSAIIISLFVDCQRKGQSLCETSSVFPSILETNTAHCSSELSWKIAYSASTHSLPLL
jgi:hypothetical protein